MMMNQVETYLVWLTIVFYVFAVFLAALSTCAKHLRLSTFGVFCCKTHHSGIGRSLDQG